MDLTAVAVEIITMPSIIFSIANNPNRFYPHPNIFSASLPAGIYIAHLGKLPGRTSP